MVRPSHRPRCTRGIAALALLLLGCAAQAQGTPATAPRADPLDAQARVPAASYQSPLASYRRLGDDKPVPWKEANDRVTRIGGWRTYLRQAQQPEAPASAPVSAPASAPVSAPASAPVSAPASAPVSAPASAPVSAPASAPAGGHKHH